MKLLPLSIMALAITACSAQKEQVETSATVAAQPVVIGGKKASSRPAKTVAMQRIYKTDGDYADRVPVTLDNQRTRLISFPAPSDLTDAAPVALADGFLLDRRGVSANTAFTRWTYKEYSAMETAPSAAEIMKNIIPGARVTEIYEMPFTTGAPDAASRCDSLIQAGLPGCTQIYATLHRQL